MNGEEMNDDLFKKLTLLDISLGLKNFNNSLMDFGVSSSDLIKTNSKESSREISSIKHKIFDKPLLKSLKLELLKELRLVFHISNKDKQVSDWAQVLLRVCELRLSTLKTRLLNERLSPTALQYKTHLLVLFFLDYYKFSNDIRYLNIVLKIFDQKWVLKINPVIDSAENQATLTDTEKLVLSTHLLLETALIDLLSVEMSYNFDPKQQSTGLQISTSAQIELDKVEKHVIVFSPSRYSLYSLAVVEQLIQAGVVIDAIVIRKLINPRRFFIEFARDGSRLIRKIWNKLVLKSYSYGSSTFPQLPDLLKSLRLTKKSLSSLAHKYGIPSVWCDTLNDFKIQKLLDHHAPDLVVFTGGGLIDHDILSRAGAGIINCHMGMLPRYRGMDVVEWPILEGRPEFLGFTTHFMDCGVDTGDILAITQVELYGARTIPELRQKYEYLMAINIAKVTIDYLKGYVKPIPQRVMDGQQYFILHSRLQKCVEILYKRILLVYANSMNSRDRS